MHRKPRAWITRRGLQLILGCLWLLDAGLQYQPSMFAGSFARGVLAPLAAGNPPWVAHPVSAVASLVGAHPVLANGAFGTIQLLIGAAIVGRRSVRVGLALSIPWALAVWWLGEGLGGELAGAPSPLSGAPGAVLLYALLATLLWPAGDTGDGAVAETGPAGRPAARAAWLVLWGGLAANCLLPVSRRPGAMAHLVAGMGAGEPGWLAAVDRWAAGGLAGHGATAAAVLAGLLLVVALAPLAGPLARPGLLLGMAVATVIWVVPENFGAILTGAGTDPNTGPLLVVLALAYWPRRPRAALAPAPSPVPAVATAGS
jgi:hypothetical protein